MNRRTILCAAFTLLTYIISAQTPDSSGVYSFATVMPSFRTGDAALFAFIHDSIHYPSDALQQKQSGRVQVLAIIDEKGNVSGVSVLRGVCPSVDSEAVRVIKLTSGMWEPGKIADQAVKVKKTIPVKFLIDTTAPQTPQHIDFIGGDAAYTAFIKDHIRIPGAVPHHNLWGIVSVAITFNNVNKILNTTVVRGAEAEMNDEALRLAALTQGKWIRTPMREDQGNITTVIQIPFTKDIVKDDGSNIMAEDIVTSGIYTDSLFKEGYQYYRNNDLIRAVNFFKSSLEKKPKNLPSSYLIMLCYIQLEEYDNACIELEWLMHVDGFKSQAQQLHLKYCTLDKGNERDKKRDMRGFGFGH